MPSSRLISPFTVRSRAIVVGVSAAAISAVFLTCAFASLPESSLDQAPRSTAGSYPPPPPSAPPAPVVPATSSESSNRRYVGPSPNIRPLFRPGYPAGTYRRTYRYNRSIYNPDWGGYYYSPQFAGLARYLPSSLYDFGTSTGKREDAVFYPPSPPPLGTATPTVTSDELLFIAPPQLAAYLNEPFYGPLATRLFTQDVPNKFAQHLAQFTAQRKALRDELSARLETLPNADPRLRSRELTAFADTQASRIDQLTTEAELLRTELSHSDLIGLFLGRADLNQNRPWRLKTGPLMLPRSQTLVYEFEVMRAAVFSQDGLSAAQRSLLREIAMELQVQALIPVALPKSANENNLVYFSPDTARVRFPADLSLEVAKKINDYKNRKNALKGELRDTLYEEDSDSNEHRVQALKQLAEKQGPGFAALDQLAEEIRLDLARDGKQPGPAVAPAFPAKLTARIAAYRSEKTSLLKGLQAKLEADKTSLDNAQVKVRDLSGSFEKMTVQVASKNASGDLPLQSVREILAAYNQENAARYAALAKEKEAIREEISLFARSSSDQSSTKSVVTLLKEFDEAVKQREIWQQYRDYKTAVFEPGLSPAQRQLLFGLALEKLALPLPGGEDQP